MTHRQITMRQLILMVTVVAILTATYQKWRIHRRSVKALQATWIFYSSDYDEMGRYIEHGRSPCRLLLNLPKVSGQ